MKLSQSKISCGVRQAHDLFEDPEDNLGEIGYYLYQNNVDQGWNDAAFIIWSDKCWSNGLLLYEYIKDNFPYSTIHKTEKADNPNSDNSIELYTWVVPDAFKFWWEDNYIDTPEEDEEEDFELVDEEDWEYDV